MAGSSVPGAAIPGLAVPGLAGAGGGGIAVIGTWTASRTIGSGTEIPYPPTMPLACPVSNTGDAGNGLIAFVSWTLPAGYLGADMAVSDDAQPSHGTWFPLGAPVASSPATGYTRSAIWACPGAFAADHVYVSPCGLPSPCYPAVIAVTIIEIENMSPYLGTPGTVTGVQNAGTIVAAGPSVPSGSSIFLAVGASDGTASLSGPGTGWTSLSGTIATGGGYTVNTAPAWALSSTGSYDELVASSSPLAWWKLADPVSSATAADSSGNGWTGTVSSVTFGEAGVVAGDTSALFASASSAKITTGFDPAPAAGITAEAWVNLDSLSQSGFPRIMSDSTTSTDHVGFELYLNASNGQVGINIGNGATYAGPNGGSVPATGWTHTAATWDGTTVRVYVAGAQVNTSALSGTPQAGTATLAIGQAAAGGSHFNGLLAEVAVYGQALTAAQIAAHAAGTPGIAAATWTTSPAADLSGASAVILTSPPPPSQPDANWPAVQFLAGLGSGALTPPGQIAWTDLTSRWLAGEATEVQMGKQYELDELQAAENTVVLDDNDGALTPQNQSGIYYPDVTADVPMRLLAWWAGRTYGVLSGFVERWPVSWDEAWYGETKTTITDVWSLQQNQLNGVLRNEMSWDPNLYAYWPCSDPQFASGFTPSASAANIAPGNGNALQVVTSKNGASPGSYSFGNSSGALPGDQSGTFWEQAGLVHASEGYGYALYCADQNYPPIATGLTVAGWFMPGSGTTQVENSLQQLIVFRGSNAAAGPVFQVYLNAPNNSAPGALCVATWNVSTRVRTNATISTQNWLEAGFFHTALSLNQGTWSAYLNGPGGAAGTATANLASSVSWIEFMGSADRQYTGAMLNGQCGHLAVFGTQLPPDRIQAIYLAGAPSPAITGNGGTVTVTGAQFATDYPATRIERLLAYGGWTGPRSISQTSTTQMAPITDIQGDTAVIAASGAVTVSADGQQASEAVNNIVFSDGGFIFTDGNGTLCYLSRGDLYTLASQWTLGESTNLGELPYLPSAVLGYDKSLLYNGAELTPSVSLSGAPVVATNQPSITAHGEYVYNATAYQNLVAQIVDEANWIVNTRGVVTLRVQQVTADAMANNALWPLVLAAIPAQPVTVYRTPQTASYTVVMYPVICEVTRTLDFQQGIAQLQITTDQFPEGQVLTVGNATSGQLSGFYALGW